MSGSPETLERALPGHAEHVTDRLPAVAGLSGDLDCRVEVTICGLGPHHRHSHLRKFAAGSGDGVGPVLGLDLAQEVIVTTHLASPSEERGSGVHGVEDLHRRVHADFAA